MLRFARTLALLAALLLGLAPIASAAGHCPTAMQAGVIAMDDGGAMEDGGMPCCPDMMPGESCQVGCVQLVTAPAPLTRSASPASPAYLPGIAMAGADWIGPSELDPPKPPLHS